MSVSCREILNRPERVLPRMLTEREQRDVLELLKYHQRASEKIGPGKCTPLHRDSSQDGTCPVGCDEVPHALVRHVVAALP